MRCLYLRNLRMPCVLPRIDRRLGIGLVVLSGVERHQLRRRVRSNVAVRSYLIPHYAIVTAELKNPVHTCSAWREPLALRNDQNHA